MQRETLRNLIRKQPFDPFRIICDNSYAYEIRHPEMAIVTQKDVLIGITRPNRPADDAFDFAIVSLGHITAAEPLAANVQQPK